jgi:hypothetical protein
VRSRCCRWGGVAAWAGVRSGRMGDDERERNVEVVRRYLQTFVTKDLAELGAVSSPGLTVLDQRIVQFWGEQDTYGLLRGLGLLPDEPIAF